MTISQEEIERIEELQALLDAGKCLTTDEAHDYRNLRLKLYPALIARIRELEAKNEALNDSRKAYAGRLQRAESRVNEMEFELKAARNTVEIDNGEIERGRAERDALKARVEALSGEIRNAFFAGRHSCSGTNRHRGDDAWAVYARALLQHPQDGERG